MTMKTVYLDNNATTIMPKEVIDTVIKWVNRGNPSSSYASANECKKLFTAFRQYISEQCGFSCDGLNGYSIIFTSGASESNSNIITSCARAFAKKTSKLPHIIISAVEHKSILMCCETLLYEKRIDLTILPIYTSGPMYGCINPEDIKNAIKPTTCLVSIMTVNNETGIRNNILEIGKICKDNKIPFHTDLVQLFSKYKIKPDDYNIDAFSASFHKLNGPPGVGILVIRNNLIKGYDLKPIIYGTQNYSLRGGTENVPSIAGSFMAYKLTESKDINKLIALKRAVMSYFAKKIPTSFITEYDPLHKEPLMIVWISPKNTSIVVPWTIYMTVDRINICNVKLKKELEDNNIIVSIGSACNTSSKKASHVVDALQIPDRLRSGVLRVSLSHDNTEEEMLYFCKTFLKIIISDKILK